MSVITLVLIVVALVLFAVAAAGVPSPPRFNLVAAGLAFYMLSLIASMVVK